MMQAPRFPYPFLCVQTDEDDGQLIIVRFPLGHITDLIVLCNSVFRQGIADAVRRIHAWFCSQAASFRQEKLLVQKGQKISVLSASSSCQCEKMNELDQEIRQKLPECAGAHVRKTGFAGKQPTAVLPAVRKDSFQIKKL